MPLEFDLKICLNRESHFWKKMPNILEIKCSTIVYKILLMSTICKFDGAENVREKRPLNIAIIGAGPGGLLSAKYSIEYGYNVTVFEQQDELGGVWVYRNITEKDKYGVNVRSSMYKGLRYVFASEFELSSLIP